MRRGGEERPAEEQTGGEEGVYAHVQRAEQMHGAAAAAKKVAAPVASHKAKKMYIMSL